MLIFAALGMAMNALNYPVVIFVIAYFLGPRFELSLGQTATILRGNVTTLIDHPVAVVLLLMSAFSVYWLGIRPAVKAGKRKRGAVSSEQ
jgi:putative tricarboxylic transport membrane protein